MKIIEKDVDSDASASGDSSNEDLVDVATLKRAYVSKDDIVEFVAKYHAQVLRPFKVAKSDKRRYEVVCPIDGCTFLAQFAFTSPFDRPPNLLPHTCCLDSSVQAAKRLSTAKYLAGDTELREYFLQIELKHISSVMIQQKAQTLGLSASYMNCVNALERLMREFYGDDRSQYPCLPSYTTALSVRGHKSTCEVVNGTFVRLAIVYREEIQAFSQYSDRGLSIDGTFLKTVAGGALLVACFRNGNLQLQIVAVAVVSIENQDNWDFFLRFLMASGAPLGQETTSRKAGRNRQTYTLTSHFTSIPTTAFHSSSSSRLFVSLRTRPWSSPSIASSLYARLALISLGPSAALCQVVTASLKTHPRFLISDRDKGLVPAIAALATIKNHFFCFRHLMENFNRQFKSKALKNAASCPRYGTLTSNNVESVNAVLKNIRKLPILDYLMAIKRYVGSEWFSSSAISTKWGMLTHRATTRMGNFIALNPSIQVSQHSESAFIVTQYVKRGDPPSEYAVQLFESSVASSCGCTKDMGAPCIHSFFCLRKVGKLGEAHQYFDKTWPTASYNRAYKQDDQIKVSPPVLKEMLTAGGCAPSKIIKRRGRSKKKRRRESQHATLALAKKDRK